MTDEESAAAVVTALKEAVATGLVTIDADRGHFNPEILEEVKEEIFNLTNYSVPFPGANEKLLASLGKQQNKWSPLYFFSGGGQDCYKCGESTCWEFNGKVIRLVTRRYPGKLQVISDESPCSFANGIQPIVTRISVPSGQMLVGNDLRHIFDEELLWGKDKKNEKYSRENSINHHAGKVRYVERYAKHGMLTGYLGSGGVDIYHHSDGILVVQASERPKSIKKDGQKYSYVCHISLGLWWYGAADYDRCVALNEKETRKTLQTTKKKAFYLHSHELASLKVKPGTYEMVHQSFPDDDVKILSQIQLVKD